MSNDPVENVIRTLGGSSTGRKDKKRRNLTGACTSSTTCTFPQTSSTKTQTSTVDSEYLKNFLSDLNLICVGAGCSSIGDMQQGSTYFIHICASFVHYLFWDTGSRSTKSKIYAECRSYLLQDILMSFWEELLTCVVQSIFASQPKPICAACLSSTQVEGLQGVLARGTSSTGNVVHLLFRRRHS